MYVFGGFMMLIITNKYFIYKCLDLQWYDKIYNYVFFSPKNSFHTHMEKLDTNFHLIEVPGSYLETSGVRDLSNIFSWFIN